MDILGVFSDDRQVHISRLQVFLLLSGYLHQSVHVAYQIIEQFCTIELGHAYTIADSNKQCVRNLLHQMKLRWRKAHNIRHRFLFNNKDWLEEYLVLIRSDEVCSTPTQIPGKAVDHVWHCDFALASERTKRRRTESIRSSSSPEELAYAASMNFRKARKVDAAKVCNDMACGTPTRAQKYRKFIEVNGPIPNTPNEALAWMMDAQLSRNQYQLTRNNALRLKSNLYPPYRQVLDAKKQCYPCELTISGNCATVKLQSLLNHTAERILLHQDEVIETLSSEQRENLTLRCKWGIDGSSGHNSYKQKFTDENGVKLDDSSILLTSMVPLQMVHFDQHKQKEIIVWNNPRPSSPKYCRPIKIQYLPETLENIKNETEFIDRQLRELVPFETSFQLANIKVSSHLMMTMIDGKVTNAITDTISSMKCHLCNATSKQFNNIDEISTLPVIFDNLQFGISSLHALIRFYECLLHLSYKLPVKKWQVGPKDPHYDIVQKNKKIIQQRFQAEIGLIVDKPKAGPGNTNDGNTARRFFRDPAKTASITGLDEELIDRFHTILQVLCCGHDIDLDKFHEFAVETARKYKNLYGWYNMPTTVHKVLMHGRHIIQHAILPIGHLSEEAQEASNKYIKAFRQYFTRKCSRDRTMEDLFRRLLVNSDPLISSIRNPCARKLRSLSPDARCSFLRM